MQKILLLCLLIGVTKISTAQYVNDAARFSQTTFGGTARITAIGGAQTAIGGDISNLAGNPAGIGVYRSSDFSISPSLNFNRSTATYFGEKTPAGVDNLNVGSLGVVFAQTFSDYTGKDNTSGWVSAGLGFGFNKINNFRNDFIVSGNNTDNSITHYFADELNQFTENSLADAAFNSFLVNYDANTSYYIPAINSNTYQVDKISTSGAQNEWVINTGGNYANKFYIGAGLGITGLRYNETADYSERGFVDVGGNDTTLQRFTITDSRRVSGTGYNFKIGGIFRPVDFIRIGATVQTPTYYQLSETSEVVLEADLADSLRLFTASTELNYAFDYNLRTPFKYNVGVALFFKKLGFITADIEQVNYDLTALSANSFSDFEIENNKDIRVSFTNVTNYRLGAEAKLGAISLRGGYAYYPHPLANTSATTSYTGGIGYKVADYYFDITVVNSQWSKTHNSYTIVNGKTPSADVQFNRNSVQLTFGTRF